MDQELEKVAKRLKQVKTPQDVFGPLESPEQLKEAHKIYRQLAMATHEDLFLDYADKAIAREAFKKLSLLWQIAQNNHEVRVQTRSREYIVGGLFANGDVSNLYKGSYQNGADSIRVVFKVTRDFYNNDLLSNEAKVLKLLLAGKGCERYWMYLPQLIESFRLKESTDPRPRQVNIFGLPEKISSPREFYSLKEVLEQYPEGIDPKDFAWIWRRVLVALGFAHINGIIHGAVLPTHILIQAKMHAVVLIDWKYAVINPGETGEHISAISSQYEAWYPREVFDKKPPTFTTDISMAARCMFYLLGGDPIRLTIPDSVPTPIRAFLKGCLSTGSIHPWDLLDEFDELIKRLWGERKFHQFLMPERH